MNNSQDEYSLFNPNLNKKLIMTDISDTLIKDNNTDIISHLSVSRIQDILNRFFS